MPDAFRFSVSMPGGLSYPDFDKKSIKKGMRKAAKPLVRMTRKAVGVRGGVSKPDTFPHKHTGGLQRSVTSKVSKSGFSFAIYESPKKLRPYYPAFVYYGHRSPKTGSKKQEHKLRHGKKVAAPRENWIVSSTEDFAKQNWASYANSILMTGIKTVFAK